MNNSVFLACSKCHEMMIKSVNGELQRKRGLERYVGVVGKRFLYQLS
jgi:hypothetical protein